MAASTDPGDPRVAVYLDFDNIVISRYDQVHGRSQVQRDRARGFDATARGQDGEVAARLRAATVDVGAVIDFASSFGTLVLTRAYADWSAPVNADYRGQLVGRAVDLVQLFPAAAYAKNGADIRLAVDAVEDMFRLPDLTHVVIVAGDSDYIALAQRCKRLGRYVVGVGVAGSSSRSLAAACDEFVTYDRLPGVDPEQPDPGQSDPGRSDAGRSGPEQPAAGGAGSAGSGGPDPASRAPGGEPQEDGRAGGRGRSGRRRRGAGAEEQTEELADEPTEEPTEETEDEVAQQPEDLQQAATRLLERALRLGHEKDDADWLHSSAVKSQIKRMDPSFSEKALGYRSFSDFIRSREAVAELDESSTARLIRLAPGRTRGR